MAEICYFCGLERKESPVTYSLPNSDSFLFNCSVAKVDSRDISRTMKYQIPLCNKHLEQLIYKMKSQFEEIIEGRARI